MMKNKFISVCEIKDLHKGCIIYIHHANKHNGTFSIQEAEVVHATTKELLYKADYGYGQTKRFQPLSDSFVLPNDVYMICFISGLTMAISLKR